MRTIGIGLGSLVIVSAFLVWVFRTNSMAQHGRRSSSFAAFYLFVLLGLVALIWINIREGTGPFAVAMSLSAISGIAAAPFLRGRLRTIAVTAGLVSWALCEVFLAGAGV
jgi:hypothetical protein